MTPGRPDEWEGSAEYALAITSEQFAHRLVEMGYMDDLDKIVSIRIYAEPGDVVRMKVTFLVDERLYKAIMGDER